MTTSKLIASLSTIFLAAVNQILGKANYMQPPGKKQAKADLYTTDGDAPYSSSHPETGSSRDAS
jgi:hypothetical protein